MSTPRAAIRTRSGHLKGFLVAIQLIVQLFVQLFVVVVVLDAAAAGFGHLALDCGSLTVRQTCIASRCLER